MDRLLVLFTILTFTQTLSAQQETNIWYFGHNAGLDFNSGIPVALTDSQLDTDEGCASISNANGELLFYTDGSFIWDKNHQVMPNGSGLLGHKSSTQSGVIIPKPGADNFYYVFTVDFKANQGGISYSEVNMDLNGGMGDVTNLKNAQLLTPACEKITAVLHENQQDLWVIGHAWNSTNFYAWRVTPTGVNNVPVISSVGTSIGGNTNNTIGYLKASALGDRIAAAHWSGINIVEVFDFNNSTGVLNNPIQLSGFMGNGAYGVEFAPTADLLYVSERTANGTLYQYDLSSNDAPTINASRVALAIYNNHWGAIQLGPDGKMYIAKRNADYLAAINQPDLLGTSCDFVEDAVYLAGRKSWIGLPSFIQSYFVAANFAFEGLCPALPTSFTFEGSESNLDSLRWDFGDLASGNNNTSTLLNPMHTFTDSGTYEVSLIVFSQNFSDTSVQEITLALPTVDLGADLTSCPEVMHTLDATTLNASYLWSDNSTLPTLEIDSAGTYSVTIEIEGCPATDSVELTHLDLPDLDLGADPTICENETFTFDGTTPNVSNYLWQDYSTDSTQTAALAGNYALTVTGTNGCTAADTATLSINPLPVFSLGADQEICTGTTYKLNTGLDSNSIYLWQDGSTADTFIVSEAGNYSVMITTNGCSETDEITVTYTSAPTVNLGNDTLLCVGESFEIDVYYGPSTTYMWQNNSDLSTYTIDAPGEYAVTLTNFCGSASDTFLVAEDNPPAPLFIGNDTILCEGDSYLLDATNVNTIYYLWQDGSNEPSLTVGEPGFYAITWANNCGFVTESIEVKNRRCECPVFFPNVFSPNGDGWNEYFNTVSPCAYDQYNMKIFSRWGELLFETNDATLEAGWDGTFNGQQVQEGVYIYVVKYAHEFGEGQISGDVSIMR